MQKYTWRLWRTEGGLRIWYNEQDEVKGSSSHPNHHWKTASLIHFSLPCPIGQIMILIKIKDSGGHNWITGGFVLNRIRTKKGRKKTRVKKKGSSFLHIWFNFLSTILSMTQKSYYLVKMLLIDINKQHRSIDSYFHSAKPLFKCSGRIVWKFRWFCFSKKFLKIWVVLQIFQL